MTFVVAGLLNVKTVDERCIRSVFCTMKSYGHQGKSKSPMSIPQELVYTELLCSVTKLLSDPFIPALSVTTVSKVQAKQERRTNFQPRVRSIYQYNQISVYIFFLIAPTKQLERIFTFCVCAELQSTRLGTYIEDRVNKYLKRQNHPEAGEVFVRVVASSDKTVEIKPGMKSR